MFAAGMRTGGATIGATARSLRKRTKSIESESGQNSNRIGEAGIRFRVPAPVVVRRGVGEADVVGVHGAGHGGLAGGARSLAGRTSRARSPPSSRVKMRGGDGSAGGGGVETRWDAFCWVALVACGAGRTGSVRVTRASDSLGRSKKEARYFTQVGEGDGPAGKTGHARAIFPCLAHEGLPLGSCVLLVGFMGYSDRGFADEKQPV